jgi:uncharacterized protein with von Willebrand factor type A (vWA) domain
MSAENHINLEFFLGFGRALRSEGLPLGSGELERYVKALPVAEVKSLREIYWVGRVCLTFSPEHVSIYDRIFQRWFQQSGDTALPSTLKIRKESFVPAGAQSQAFKFELPTNRGNQSGQAAAWNEHLGMKRLDPPDEAELSLMRSITASLNSLAPLRLSRRFRAGGRNGPPHLRSMIRSSYRTDGELFRLIRSKRLTRIRPLVLLVDVSKSMSAHSRAFAQFARAALRRTGRTEVLCFGTQLTPVTRLLKSGDAAAALQRTSAAVHDWDGGTRLSDALDDLLRSRRRTHALRGAIVILLSDGLERGSCEVTAKNMDRLSRLAHRLYWINPLWADPQFAPRASGIRAILPRMDKVYGCQNLSDVARIVPTLFNENPAVAHALRRMIVPYFSE